MGYFSELDIRLKEMTDGDFSAMVAALTDLRFCTQHTSCGDCGRVEPETCRWNVWIAPLEEARTA